MKKEGRPPKYIWKDGKFVPNPRALLRDRGTGEVFFRGDKPKRRREEKDRREKNAPAYPRQQEEQNDGPVGLPFVFPQGPSEGFPLLPQGPKGDDEERTKAEEREEKLRKRRERVKALQALKGMEDEDA